MSQGKMISALKDAGYEKIVAVGQRLICAPGALLDDNKQFRAMAVAEKLGLHIDVRLHGVAKDLIIDMPADAGKPEADRKESDQKQK